MLLYTYTFALVAILAAPGALAVPFRPIYHAPSTDSSSSSDSKVSSRFIPPAPKPPSQDPQVAARAPRSYKVDIGHRLSEYGGIHRRSTADVNIAFDTYWFAKSRVGSQDVTMLVDTGSADLWIVGPDADVKQRSLIQSYEPATSKSAVQMPDHSFEISYGNGENSVSGPVFQDSFAVGSAAVAQMPIGSAQNIIGIDPGTFKSGILGLGFQGGNSVRPNPQPTFMEALAPVLDEPVFVCNFKMDGSGHLEFGHVDESLFEGPLTGIRADNETKYPASWSAEEVTYVSNGKPLGQFDIVFDTGGPSTSGPAEIVDAYYAQIEGAQDASGDGSIMLVPCEAEMPDLEFHFRNGAVGKIPGKNLIQGDVGGGLCRTWFGRENSVNRGLVGDPFFNSNVVVFNQQQGTIQWAPQA